MYILFAGWAASLNWLSLFFCALLCHWIGWRHCRRSHYMSELLREHQKLVLFHAGATNLHQAVGPRDNAGVLLA